MADSISLAGALKRLREDRGWTQEELAERLDVSGATISRWEGGHHAPTLEHVQKIAELLGVDPYRFVQDISHDRHESRIVRRFLEASALEHGEIEQSRDIGDHVIVLLSDGSLLVNGVIRIWP